MIADWGAVLAAMAKYRRHLIILGTFMWNVGLFP